MREILFRGKRLCNNKWMFGSLFCWNNGDCFIVVDDFHHSHYKVDPETVGQFTGRIDKNGKKIFEGDIARIHSDDYIGVDEVGKVVFQDGCFGVSYFPEWMRDFSFGDWRFHRIGEVGHWQDMGASGEIRYTEEVIGNIHDNPELLEAK